MQLLTPVSDTLLNSDGSVRFMDVKEIINLGVDICSALEVCEKRNIIHRDIKIDNIFVSENGDYKLGDFGIAKQLEATQGEMSKKGTLLYMAPEVFRGEKYDKTADIYSLGVVLYRLLNKNRAPFFPNYPNPIKFSDKEIANTKRLKGEEFPDIIGIGPELNEVLKKACAFNPKDRYLSANEFKSALNGVTLSMIFLGTDEPTAESVAPVFEESVKEDATVGVFSDIPVVIVEDNAIDEDKTESVFDMPPVISETENTSDEITEPTLKEEEQIEETTSEINEAAVSVFASDENTDVQDGEIEKSSNVKTDDENSLKEVSKNKKSIPTIIKVLIAVVAVVGIFYVVDAVSSTNNGSGITIEQTVEETIKKEYDLQQFYYNQTTEYFTINDWDLNINEFDEVVYNCKGFSVYLEISDIKSGEPYGSWSIYTRNLEGEWEETYVFDCTPESTFYEFSCDKTLEPFDAFVFVRNSEGSSEHLYDYNIYDFIIA